MEQKKAISLNCGSGSNGKNGIYTHIWHNSVKLIDTLLLAFSKPTWKRRDDQAF